jgi:hypothetical protein
VKAQGHEAVGRHGLGAWGRVLPLDQEKIGPVVFRLRVDHPVRA